MHYIITKLVQVLCLVMYGNGDNIIYESCDLYYLKYDSKQYIDYLLLLVTLMMLLI